MVPSEPPNVSNTVNTLPVASSETLAASWTSPGALWRSIASPSSKLAMTAWKLVNEVAVRSSTPAPLSEPSKVTVGLTEFVPTAASNLRTELAAAAISNDVAVVPSTAVLNSSLPPLAVTRSATSSGMLTVP